MLLYLIRITPWKSVRWLNHWLLWKICLLDKSIRWKIKPNVNEYSTVTLTENELLKIVSYGTETSVTFNAFDKQ